MPPDEAAAPSRRRTVTEYLAIDLDARTWVCRRCDHVIGPATEGYKKGCLVTARDPSEIWRPLIEEKYTFSFDPGWARVVEFYCPGCGTLVEVELLPPGHPITDDIRLDLDLLEPDESVVGAEVST
jgi:acetophenone carboxylase